MCTAIQHVLDLRLFANAGFLAVTMAPLLRACLSLKKRPAENCGCDSLWCLRTSLGQCIHQVAFMKILCLNGEMCEGMHLLIFWCLGSCMHLHLVSTAFGLFGPKLAGANCRAGRDGALIQPRTATAVGKPICNPILISLAILCAMSIPIFDVCM